jgi:hypothetical protein
MRTGSVAMFQIMREIVESQAAGFAPMFPARLEIEYWEENIGDWTGETPLVIAKLHRWEDFLDPHALNLRVVMTVRDVRDVVVSLMNFRGGDYKSTVHSNAFKGNIREQIRWEAHAGEERLLKIRYEDFVLARAATTRQVADFMGIKLSLSEAMRIEQKWNINANLRRSKQDHAPGHPEFMSPRHIHSGRANQWKTALTPEQILDVQDRVGREWFEENGYELWTSDQLTVFIMAGGEAARWKGPVEKQIVDVNGELLLSRTVRQVRRIFKTEPRIISSSKDIINKVSSKYLVPGNTIADSLYSIVGMWRSRAIILHGDTYFTDEVMEDIATCFRPIVFHGRLLEIYALTFTDHVLMQEAVRGVEDTEGRLWHLWYFLNGHPLDVHTYPDGNNKYFCQLDPEDITMDLDYLKDYQRLMEIIAK